jgi:hypothetical protein
MMKRRGLLFSAVVSIALLLAASGVKAATATPALNEGCNTLPGLPSFAVPVARSCQIYLNALKTQYVTIQAGPDLTINPTVTNPFPLANQFPIPVPNPAACLDGTQPSQCLCDKANSTCNQWQYKWTLSGGGSLTNAMTSAASDVTVFSSNPATATVFQPLLALGERFLSFPVRNQTTFTASYYTPPNITAGTLTAGFTGINGLKPLIGRCALAGAQNLTVPANLATPSIQTQTFTIPGPCIFSLSIDPTTGKVVPNTTTLLTGSASYCQLVETNSLVVDGKPVINISAGQWTELGSCSSCLANGFGGKTCVTCKTCTVVNGVCTAPAPAP